MDAYDHLLDHDALYRGDLTWLSEIGEHEFPEEGYGYALNLRLYERVREILFNGEHSFERQNP